MNLSRRRLRRLLSSIAAASAAAALFAGSADAYSFLTTPTDQMAVPGQLVGAEILPNHDIYTGWMEFGIRVGSEASSLSPLGRDLEQGRYPIIRSQRVVGGVLYVFQTFMSTVFGRGVVFGRVTVVNLSNRFKAQAQVAGSVRYNAGKLVGRGARKIRRYRFPRPLRPDRSGLYDQPGGPFSDQSVIAFNGRALTRDGQILYVGPVAGAGETLVQDARPEPGPMLRITTVGQSTYKIELAAGESRTLDFTVPVIPAPSAGPEQAAFERAEFNTYREKVIDYWSEFFDGAMQLDLPEEKPQQAYYAALMTMALPRYRTNSGSGQWVQTVNKLRYHAFYLRDASIITNAFDLVGLHRIAGENLPFFLTWQRPDGLFISRPDQYDGFGQSLWVFGEHAKRAANLAFVRSAFPAVERAMAWFIAARKADPLGLLPPVSNLNDNELTAGHLAGDNFWAHAGVRSAIEIAKSLGRNDLANQWATELAAFRRSLLAALATATKATGGWISPSLDGLAGQDWGNLWSVYPLGVLGPNSAEVSDTQSHAREKFREGIATYADTTLLHAYLGFRVTQTSLLRDEQDAVVNDFYNELAHTTGTHSGFETNVAPFGNRQVEDATTPHAWYSAEYVALLRNMLVREQGRDVLLTSAIPGAWLRPEQTTSVTGAKTYVGRVSFTLRTHEGGATLTWQTRLASGSKLRMAVPVGAGLVKAKGLSVDRKTILLPGASGSVEISWSLRVPVTTYESAVTDLQKSYAEYRGPKIASAPKKIDTDKIR